MRHPTREEAVEELMSFGIEKADVYLIDLIPLIEMAWADGRTQPAELRLVEDFLVRHVHKINLQARHGALTEERARAFIGRFLRERPESGLLRTLRSFVAPVRLSGSDEAEMAALRDSLLASCLDIAASAVLKYPFEDRERFNLPEKRCFFEILESLSPGG